MSKSKLTIFSEFYDLENQAIRSYFGRVVDGQPKVYQTPFAQGETTEHLLQGWLDRLEVIKHEWPSLFEFEKDLANKVGPMSVMKPLKDRITDIDHYYDDILLSSEPLDEKAIKATLSEWSGLGGLRLRTPYRTAMNMKLSTNSGSPYFTKRRKVFDETVFGFLEEYVPNEPLEWISHDGTDWKLCATLGWRGQEGGPSTSDVKQRVVWMFPFALNIAELCFYQPLIEGAQQLGLVPAWISSDAVDERVTSLFNTKELTDLVICTDFSKFDQHFNASLQNAAKDVFAALNGSEEDVDTDPLANVPTWLRNVFPMKYVIPLAYDYGQIRYGAHGMASGSGGTNADETIAHRCLQYEAAQRNGSKLNPYSQCLGDDGMLSYPSCNVDDVVKAYTSHGLEMNPDKQYASDSDCVYLRKWYHNQYRVNGICRGVYSTCRALGRLRYLERYMDPRVWSKEAVALRQLSILENCKWHPLKEEFVHYCMKRDKYRLGIDIPDFFKNLSRITEEITAEIPDFLGYTKSVQSTWRQDYGISGWWIVQYLKSLT